MSDFNSLLQSALDKRRTEGTLRSLSIKSNSLIDFSSNDYLGLANSQELLTKISKNVLSQKDRLKNGATGSRLLTGNNKSIEEVEEKLASIFKGETSLLFNSGYAANLAVLSCLPKRGDTILLDELSHASIKDGVRLSMASRQSFKHNNTLDLEKKIKRATGNIFVVAESIYSMDGDQAPLSEIITITKKHNAYFILDEAHSTGVFGLGGNGLACALELEKKIDVRICTFGKALGLHGACVVGAKLLRDYLVNFARPFIYTTAPDIHSVIAISTAFDYLKENQALQEKLFKNVEYFKKLMGQNPRLIQSDSAIQSFIIKGNEAVKKASADLEKSGFDVRPILSPTVPKDLERLRIIIHSFNTNSEIELLTQKLLILS